MIEQPFFKHFQTLASFSCKVQRGIFQCPLNTSCGPPAEIRGADNIKHVPKVPSSQHFYAGCLKSSQKSHGPVSSKNRNGCRLQHICCRDRNNCGGAEKLL